VVINTHWLQVFFATMPAINCPIDGCPFVTDDVDASIAAALLMVHNNVHTAAAPETARQKAPKINRPTVIRVDGICIR
jgi:hypothetical protein